MPTGFYIESISQIRVGHPTRAMVDLAKVYIVVRCAFLAVVRRCRSLTNTPSLVHLEDFPESQHGLYFNQPAPFQYLLGGTSV